MARASERMVPPAMATDPFNLGALARFGWNADVAHAWERQRPLGAQPARLTAVHRATVELELGHGRETARVLPALLGESFATGDWVAVEPDEFGAPWVVARLERRTELARATASGARQLLAANVDVLFVVMGLDGDWSPRRAERYLALSRQGGVEAVVVLTKADLCEAAAERVAELEQRLPPEAAIHAVDGRGRSAAAVLARHLGPGRTAVLLGSSGAGKSTLANTLLGADVQRTGAVREGDDTGKHTTTSRVLLALPDGACLIDTPGLRGLQLSAGEEEVQELFVDVSELAAKCHFRDCRHEHEPGCAVRGHVDSDRLDNLHKMQREAARLEEDAQARKERRGGDKAISKALRAWVKQKRAT